MGDFRHFGEYQGFLGAAYLWVKAAHVTFAIF